MRICIAYYSKTEEIEKLAQAIKKEFEARGHTVDLEKIRPKKESSFFGWLVRRIIKRDCQLYPPQILNVSKHDAICIGSPAWIWFSLPVTKYLKMIEGLKYKKVGFFSTTSFLPILKLFGCFSLLFDLTFHQILEEKGTRMVASVVFSNLFKKSGINSNYRQKMIKNFCDKIEEPLFSIKDYFLNRKEIKNNVFLTNIFSFSIILSLIAQAILSFFGKAILNWKEYFYFTCPLLLSLIFLALIQERKNGIFLGKYIGTFSFILLWILFMFYSGPELLRILFFGNVLILSIVGFFQDFKTVIVAGTLSILSYGILFNFHPAKEVLNPILDLALIIISIGVIAFIAKNVQRYNLILLEAYDDLETNKTVLEIKVKARIRELRELAENLDEQVKERTRELQTKLQELEKFQKLTIGRELKMIELKKENQKLKEEIKILKEALVKLK